MLSVCLWQEEVAKSPESVVIAARAGQLQPGAAGWLREVRGSAWLPALLSAQVRNAAALCTPGAVTSTAASPAAAGVIAAKCA